MQRLIILIGLTVLACAASRVDARASVPGVATAPPWCGPSTEMVADFMLQKIIMIATSQSPEDTAYRDSVLAGMPRVNAEDVRFVTDEAVCHRASLAVDTAFFEGRPENLTVYVVRAGTYFSILPKTTAPLGVYHSMLYTDSAFKAIAITLF